MSDKEKASKVRDTRFAGLNRKTRENRLPLHINGLRGVLHSFGD